MLYVYNKAEELLRVVPIDGIKSADSVELLNAAWQLEVVFKDPADLADAYYLAHKDTLNPETIRMYKLVSSSWTGKGVDALGIESAYDDLQADGYIKDLRPENKTVRDAATDILDGSRWQTGVTSTTKTVSTNFYYVSRLEALQKLLELTGCEMQPRIEFDGRQITGRYVDIFDQIGEDRGKRYEHGSSLLEVIKEDSRTELYTALVGRGRGEEAFDEEGNPTGGFGRKLTFVDAVWLKANGNPVDKPGGQEFVEIPEFTAAFGYPDGKPRVGFVEFSDITDPYELLEATYQQLLTTARPRVYYQSRVRDVGDTGLGDTVTIIRDDLGIRYKVRIVKRTINLLNPAQVVIELGDKPQNYVATRIADLQDQIAAREDDYRSNYLRLVDVISSAYWGEDGYTYDLHVGNEYGLPAGIYSFDQPIDQNPTKVIYMGAGKLLIADEKNSDNSWKFKTFLTGSGLAANTVTAENIVAAAISSDHISATGINADKIVVADEENLTERLIEINNREIVFRETMEVGGRNLFVNPTFGTVRFAETTGWFFSHPPLMERLLHRYEGRTMANLLSVVSSTAQSIDNFLLGGTIY